MNFKKLTLSDIDRLRPFFDSCENRLCDCTTGGTFMWREYYETEYLIEDDTLILRVSDLHGGKAYAMPIGGDVVKAVKRIDEYCLANGVKTEFCMMTRENADLVASIVKESKIYSQPEWFDYVYNAEDIKTLGGRKYSGQRNHINKFLKNYENPEFLPVTKDNAGEVIEFMQHFITADDGSVKTLTTGNIMAVEILNNLDLYKPLGGVLKAEGKIVGFSLGETVGDTLFIHVEKALREYQGAYPYLVREFAKMYADEGINYINREEDDGNEGLRTSKLSYHPAFLLEKFAIIAR